MYKPQYYNGEKRDSSFEKKSNEIPRLQNLHSREHVDMACRVLLYDVFYIVRLQGLLKLTAGHIKLDLVRSEKNEGMDILGT